MNTNTRLEDMKIAPREAFRRSRKMYEPSGSRKLEALRQKPLRVAVYNCYEATEQSLTQSSTSLEEILYGTPAWVPMGVFVDQCGQDSDLASHPALSAMITEGWYDLILCKSLSHLHSHSEEQLKSDKEPVVVGDKNILQKFTGFFWKYRRYSFRCCFVCGNTY